MSSIQANSATLPGSTIVSIATVLGVVGVVLAIAQQIWWRRKYGKPDGQD